MQDRLYIQRRAKPLCIPSHIISRKEFARFLLFCRHVPSQAHPSYSCSLPSSRPSPPSGEIGDGFRASSMAKSLCVSAGRRPNATYDSVGDQCPSSFHRPVGHQLGISHVLQADGIVLSCGKCTHEKSPRDLARIWGVVRDTFDGDHHACVARRLGPSRGLRQSRGANLLAVALRLVESPGMVSTGFNSGRHVPNHRRHVSRREALLYPQPCGR